MENKILQYEIDSVCDYCGNSHSSISEFNSCKSISSEIGEIFSSYSDNEDSYSKAYVKQTFGIKFDDHSRLNIDKKPNDTEDEYFYLVALLYGKNIDTCPRCESGKMERVTGRTWFACRKCWWNISPCVDTIFEKSTTPLKTWFNIMVRMAVSKITIMELKKEFGICYHTAHRLYHLIYNAPFYAKLSDVKNTPNYYLIKHEIDDKIFDIKRENLTKICKQKLTKQDILNIRRQFDDGVLCKEIAATYGMDVSYIRKIANRKSYN